MKRPRKGATAATADLSGVSTRVTLVLAPLAVACFSGCNAPLAQNAECSARVIVGFAAEPDDALVADLERTNAVELEPLGTIMNDLRVYMLRAAGPHDECVAAIERLRDDERVRSVDLDARRELHGEQ